VATPGTHTADGIAAGSPQATAQQGTGTADARLHALMGRLTLEEKVRLLTGRDFWSTWPLESVGLRPLLMSDGPSGVRGEVWDERSPSLNLPSATALSSSWDPGIARRYGACAAAEARRKNVHIVLGPTINLHRTPLGGRHFEAFSEDPLLTGELAAAYIRGLQQNGVAATPKHYVANDFETDRFTVDVIVSDRALRELYLLPFEKAVTDGQAWLVMSAYNSVNGVTATENELLETPLNSEWGFDGVVVSDWTAVRSLRSAEASQDLVMPGPDGPWGAALAAAVRDGRIAESVVDRKVLRILRLAARVGALSGFKASAPAGNGTPEDGPGFAREAAAEGTVLLRNAGELPWRPERLSRIAVIGQHATQPRTQGGGSATVVPSSTVSPLQGIRAAFPGAEIVYEPGAVVQDGIIPFAPEAMTNPVTGEPGAHVRLLDAGGEEIFAEERFASALVYFGGDAPIAPAQRLEFATRLTPEKSGPLRIGFASVGLGRIFAGGSLIGEQAATAVGTDLGAAFLAPPAISFPVDVTAGQPLDVRIELEPVKLEGGLSNALSVTFGTELPPADPDALIERAAQAAAGADVAVVVVGSSTHGESEGYDRTTLALPGRQDELVRAVAAANPRTVVVVNAGAPVIMPWRDQVSAILLTYFGGQEYGHALADVLTGIREPGGRLPTTWPAEQGDVPVIGTHPADGVLRYDEGIHIGYRAWLRTGTEPAYPFGYGLGYTTWDLGPAEVSGDNSDAAATIRVRVTNTGDRAGKHVVQAYAERAGSAVDRPVRWLVGFAAVHAEAAATTTVEIRVPHRTLAYWDAGWHVEPGTYTLRVGHNVRELPLALTITL
jgi:beta-glucosidase